MALFPLGILSAAGAGFSSDYELISTSLISSPTASVTFSSLGDFASTYKHLQIRAVAKDAFTGGAAGDFYLTFNGAGSNYRDHYLRGNGTTVASGSFGYTTVIAAGDMVSSSAGNANRFGAYVIDILDFASTTKNTTTRTLSGYLADGANTIFLSSGAYFVTNAITSINLRSNANLVAGSRFSLYGIKG
jgi:hypothetical protein